MKKYLSKLAMLFLALPSWQVLSITINADVVGDQITWRNASVVDGNIIQSIWDSSAGINVHPVYEWRPAFKNSNQTSIKLASSLGGAVETSFEYTGIEFRYGGDFKLNDSGSNYATCYYESSPSGYYSLMGGDLCVASQSLKSTSKYKPFEFYRNSIRLDSIVSDFKRSNVPAGLYYATVQLPVLYMVKYNGVDSYQSAMAPLSIIVNYTPSYLDAVSITGDGVFVLDYDTARHSVSGKTKFSVDVTGHIEPGLKMTFDSLGDADEFNLEHNGSGDKIPYSMKCDDCEKTLIIQDGMRMQENAKIPYVGEHMKFDLDFYFNDISAGEVSEGDYKDAVKVLFEIDL